LYKAGKKADKELIALLEVSVNLVNGFLTDTLSSFLQFKGKYKGQAQRPVDGFFDI
jgi:hypothetical protein